MRIYIYIYIGVCQGVCLSLCGDVLSLCLRRISKQFIPLFVLIL